MKVLLLGASFTTNNMGVGALAAGSIKSILSSHPDAEVVLLDYGREAAWYPLEIGGRTITVRLANLRFSKKFYLKNNIAWLLAMALLARLLPVHRWRARLISSNPWLREISEARLCAAISGGDSFSDIYGMPRLLYVALPQILVLLLKQRLVLLPQTIGPFKSVFARAIARFIVRRAERTYSRDQQGVEVTRALIGNAAESGRARFCYDVGFVVDPAAPARIECRGASPSGPRDFPLVGLNVSGLLYMGGYSKKDMFGLGLDYPAFVRALIEHLIQRSQTAVLLAPHVFGSASDEESDAAVCRTLYEELAPRFPGRLGCLEGQYNQSEIKHIIGQCDFFAGSRMHACIAAISQCVPAVAIAYSDKFRGVMESIGVPSIVADPRKMSSEQILDLIAQTFANRHALRSQLAQKIPGVQQTVLRLFSDLTGPHAGGDRA